MRTAFAAAAIVLVLTEVGVAQCGWILWSKIERSSLNRRNQSASVSWDFYDGFENVAECRAEALPKMKALIQVMVADNYGTLAPEGSRSASFFSNAKGDNREVVSASFLCLPGGFDPRK